MVKADFWS